MTLFCDVGEDTERKREKDRITFKKLLEVYLP
jgi:hypothetical protein